MTRLRLLKATLWLSALAEFVYFSLSHWFFHREFFHALGIHGPDLESPFVVSQLQLIGAMVMGYALMNLIVASDPLRYRPLLTLILAIGSICVAIFVVSVCVGTLPAMFLVNAAMVFVQVALVAMLLPARTQESHP
jgi:hypothetical protein